MLAADVLEAERLRELVETVLTGAGTLSLRVDPERIRRHLSDVAHSK